MIQQGAEQRPLWPVVISVFPGIAVLLAVMAFGGMGGS